MTRRQMVASMKQSNMNLNASRNASRNASINNSMENLVHPMKKVKLRKAKGRGKSKKQNDANYSDLINMVNQN